MTGAMYAAVSGLRAHMTALNVIGNNISNVNTLGYKATRYTFNEALYTTTRSGDDGTTQQGGVNPAQIGYGTSIGTIDLDMSTKTYNPTGMQMDCMIDGDGMFILGDKTNADGIKTQEQLQGMTLSRLGNFKFDSEGWLTDGNGSIVYGFLCTGYDEVTQKYTYTPTLSAIRAPNCVDVLKTMKDANGNDVNYVDTTVFYPTVAPTDVEATEGDENTPGTPAVSKGDIVDGVKPTTPSLGITQEDIDAMKDAQVKRVNLSSCSIDKTGRITGFSQDGDMVVVGYVALAQLDNPNGLTHVDGRYYKSIGGAGDVHLCSIGGNISYVPTLKTTPGEDGTPDTVTVENPAGVNDMSAITVQGSGDTELVNGGLESSGTDLATEISNMIIIQRGYQANTRIVTVTDSMLEELVNMKR